jgi:hypothetical protein
VEEHGEETRDNLKDINIGVTSESEIRRGTT